MSTGQITLSQAIRRAKKRTTALLAWPRRHTPKKPRARTLNELYALATDPRFIELGREHGALLWDIRA